MGSWKDIKSSVKPTFDLDLESITGSPESLVDNLPPPELTPEEIAAGIALFKQHLAKMPKSQSEPIYHCVGDIVASELHIAAGTVFVGEEYGSPGLFVLHVGTLTMLTNAGVRKVSAPFIEVVAKNAQRIGVAHTDVVALVITA